MWFWVAVLAGVPAVGWGVLWMLVGLVPGWLTSPLGRMLMLYGRHPAHPRVAATALGLFMILFGLAFIVTPFASLVFLQFPLAIGVLICSILGAYFGRRASPYRRRR